jgi:hypothetical protein
MKIALTTAVLALAPIFMAQAADLPHQKRSSIPSCVDFSGGGGDSGSAFRQAAAAGAIPCPEFLSTKTIERKRIPQWT